MRYYRWDFLRCKQAEADEYVHGVKSKRANMTKWIKMSLVYLVLAKIYENYIAFN